MKNFNKKNETTSDQKNWKMNLKGLLVTTFSFYKSKWHAGVLDEE